MPSPRDRSMLVRAASLYYLEGRSQSEVADAIGVTRSNVSRVLAEARRLGIVEIRVHGDVSRDVDLERELIERFNLRDARVAVALYDEPASTVVGKVGAEWLLEHLPSSGTVAVSWGQSVQSVVEATHSNNPHPDLEVLPLVGGLSRVESTRDANVLVRELASRLGASHRRLYAPAVVESVVSRDALMNEPAIGDVLEDAKRADIAIVGVGAVGSGASEAIVRSMDLSAADAEAFRHSGAVGDCCTRFFDATGTAIAGPVSERVIAVELDDLRRIPTVLGVAHGKSKVDGYLAGLRGGLFRVAVVDTELAELLLRSAH